MRPYRLHTLAVLAALLASWGFGCASRRPKEPLPPTLTAANIVDLAAPASMPDGGDRAVVASLVARCGPTAPGTLTSAPTKPLNVLALSGGGQYGSYAAGVLCGWTATGQRPEFDVVTGISSGALIASLAFLGPKYDPQLELYFTTLAKSDLFDQKPVRYLFKYKSLASSAPIKGVIDRTFNDEYMEDLRAAHRAGRRLYMGTMNQNTRKLVVWDMGAIACSGRPDAKELFRTIVLAAVSITGFAPSVEIPVEFDGKCYKETHVDGGGVAQVFVRLGENHPRPTEAGGNWLAGSNLYLIAGGKLYADPVPGPIGFFSKLTGNISATLYALYRADLMKLYALCTSSGMKFQLAAVPPDLDVPGSSVSFEPTAMRALFDRGYAFGKAQGPWRNSPPGAEVGEDPPARHGIRFQSGPVDPAACVPTVAR